MITLAPIGAHNLAAFRKVRLQALQESPLAFGSTYARESQFTPQEWIERVARWDGQRGIGFLATDDREACGMVGSFLDEHDPTLAHLIAMWTSPTHRHRGVGRLLVDAVMAWSAQRGARTVLLMVTSTNDSAIAFYERLGFARTGRTEPYPNDPAACEYEMSRPIR